MSVKSQFLEKLQARKPAPILFTSKSQADIAEFRLRMVQLQGYLAGCAGDTGLNVETFTVAVTDLLVEDRTFEIAAINLRYDDRSVKFTPVFLYGQGVTGCVEVTLYAEGSVTSVGRLFMRADHFSDWSFTPPGALSRPGQSFDENTFFSLILALLP